MTDDRLSAAILGSEAVALFENAYAAYAREAQQTARAFVGSTELAVDVVHNAFLEILRHLLSGGRWSGPEEARAVVLRNTRWAALKMLRTRRRRRETDAVDSPPAPADGDEDATWARWEAQMLCEQIIAGLPARQREALYLHFSEGLANHDAAARLGLTASGFASLLQRAIGAARRAAHGTGVLAGFVAAGYAQRRKLRIGLATAATAGCATLVAAQAVGAVVQSPTVPPAVHLSATQIAPRVAAQPQVATDTIAGIVFVDAVAPGSGPNPGVILAIGRGSHCNCWVIARSLDAGGSWDLAPLAPPADRVDLAARYPHATRPDARHVLTVGDHLLFFPPAGGISCSADGGRSWRPACAE